MKKEAAQPVVFHLTWWWVRCVCQPVVSCCLACSHRFNGVEAKRDNFTGRMYNVTRNTNLNYDNCDWAASNCSVRGAAHRRSTQPQQQYGAANSIEVFPPTLPLPGHSACASTHIMQCGQAGCRSTTAVFGPALLVASKWGHILRVFMCPLVLDGYFVSCPVRAGSISRRPQVCPERNPRALQQLVELPGHVQQQHNQGHVFPQGGAARQALFCAPPKCYPGWRRQRHQCSAGPQAIPVQVCLQHCH